LILELENGARKRIPDLLSQERGIPTCPDLIVRENETIGEAVMRSACECQFCHRMRAENIEEGWQPTKYTPCVDPPYTLTPGARASIAAYLKKLR